MNTNAFTKLVIIIAMIVPFGSADADRLGDTAAQLQLSEFVKGQPFRLQKGKVYVVEFWATWCGPCLKSIPHLTKLQQKYRDKGVVFVGISNEDAQTVRPFVAEMGNKMNYAVAIDSNRRTGAGYMAAYGQDGIPTAFIVDKERKVVWVGHPMSGLDEALRLVTAETRGLNDTQDIGEQQYSTPQLSEYFQYAKSGSHSKAAALGEKILAANRENANLLNEFAWGILTASNLQTRDLDLAMKTARAAYFATKGQNGAVLDTYARAFYMKGDVNSAVRYQKKAISFSTDPLEKNQLTSTLKEYQKLQMRQ
jgi:thiol-disulfide isomerase/thioredoxin